MLEDYEESISLTLRTRSFRKSFRMQQKIGNTNGSSHALQDMQEKQAWKDPHFNSQFACILEAK